MRMLEYVGSPMGSNSSYSLSSDAMKEKQGWTTFSVEQFSVGNNSPVQEWKHFFLQRIRE